MRWYIIILFQFVFTTSISMGLEIQKGDCVYFELQGYEIKTSNFKLKPYFKMYRKTETDWKKVSETWSFNGNQQDEIPNVQKYFLNMTKDDSIYRIDVRSAWDDSFVAVGREIKIQDILDCAENGNLFVISNENSSENKNSLKLQRLRHDGNNFKIGIEKYNILHFDDSFIQNL
ncbi:MAG: hypothetical protein K6C40_14855, partial [Thermoguttaceae bacterium]|nr:hypothetical protein [Thermoguttaceae bacterium]